MFNLKMVTYELDLTQFLVDAETDEEAIQKAIHANCSYEFDSEEDEKDAKDKINYSVEDIYDMRNLYYICRRTDIMGFDNNETIMYVG